MRYRIFIVGILVLIGVLGIFYNSYTQGSAIIISEIGASEASGLEWIELYNRSNEAIDVTDWIFFEAETNHTLTLVQGTSTIQAKEFFVVAQDSTQLLERDALSGITVFDSAWGSLNEKGESLAIKDQIGNIVEQFVYIASSNFSLEKIDLDAFIYSAENWKEHPTGHSLGKENYWSSVPTEDLPPENEGEPDVQEHGFIPIVINEVVSDPESGGEWIELLSLATTSVQVANWEIYDSSGKIATVSSTLEPGSFFVVELARSVLNNTGDTVILRNHTGIEVERIVYGVADGAVVSAPQKGQSIARTMPASGEFVITTTITKGEKNSIVFPVPEEGSSPQEPPASPSSTPTPTGVIGDIVINELVSDPADDSEEFIELYNSTQATVSIDGWYIEDGSEGKTVLQGNIPGQGFFVVEKPKGSLNNAGDLVLLFDAYRDQMDSVAYGSWDDGNKADNAPVAKDPQSLSRKSDGSDTDYDYHDFVITDVVTPGESNRIHESGMLGQGIYTKDLRISELFPNPKGSDTEQEFIELFNYGEIPIALQGWQMGDNSKKIFRFTDNHEIHPFSYLLLYRSETGISLNNSGTEEVHVFAPNGEIIDSLQYSGSVKEESSFARFGDTRTDWTTLATPGKENVLQGQAAAPQIVFQSIPDAFVNEPISFDASDTIDEDSDSLSFFWDLGDTTTSSNESFIHRYTQPGIYTIQLTVQDSEANSSTMQRMIRISDVIGATEQFATSSYHALRITELVPNPEGTDDTEFIELFNAGFVDIDISDLFLDDEDGGSKPYRFPSGTSIAAQSYRVFSRTETKLALNNTADHVRLLSKEKDILLDVAYDGSVEGAAYVLDDVGNWVWSQRITPGEISYVEELDIILSSTKKNNKEKIVLSTTIAGAKQQDVGDMVDVYGVVAVEPGVFGTQYFYMVDEEQQAIQVYMYKKDFPSLSIGDGMYVRGELAMTKGEWRIKTSDKEDIRAHDHPNLEDIMTEDIAHIKEAQIQFVRIAGEVTEAKSSYLYVDDGTDEIKIYLKKGANVPKKFVSVGDLVDVTGILITSGEELQLLPRSSKDIIKTGVVEESIIDKGIGDSVNEGSVAQTYLTATAGGISSLLLGMLAKVHGATIWRRTTYVLEKIIRRA